MSDSRVHFMFFEKSNFLMIKPLFDGLISHPSIQPVYIRGFDFKEYTNQISPLTFPEHYPVCNLDDTAEQTNQTVQNQTGSFPIARARDGTADQTLVDSLLFSVSQRSYIPVLEEQVAVYEQMLEKFCQSRQQGVVVLPEDTDYIRGRLACRVLSRFNFRIIILTANYYNYFVRYPLVGKRFGHLYLTATRPMKTRLQNQLRINGLSPDTVHFCGTPAFDRFKEINCSGTRILYVCQDLPNESRVCLEIADILDREFNGTGLTIRPHPESPRPKWIDELSVRENVSPSSPDSTLEQDFEKSIAIVAQTSGVIYLALVADAPVIIPNFSGLPLPIDLPDAIRNQSEVKNRTEICRLILKILENRYALNPVDWLLPKQPSTTLLIQHITSQLEQIG